MIQSFENATTIPALVHLIYEDSSRTNGPFSNIAQLVYKDVADIPKLISRCRGTFVNAKNVFGARPSALVKPVEPQKLLARAKSTQAEKGVTAGCELK